MKGIRLKLQWQKYGSYLIFLVVIFTTNLYAVQQTIPNNLSPKMLDNPGVNILLASNILNLGEFFTQAGSLCYGFECTRNNDQDTSRQNISVMMADLTPNGWKMYDKIKQFTAENLYEQINGRAEFYLAYDVIGLTFVSFEKSINDGMFIDLSIYDMGNPTNAFGVFSGERSKGAPQIRAGRDGYRTGANYYIWKGQYYIQIIASDTSVELQQIGMDLTKKTTDFLQDSGEPVWGLTVLPEADRVPGSVQYFLVDAMGLDFMRNTYIAQYDKGGIEVTVFLSQHASPDSAQTTVDRFVEHANLYGKEVNLSTVNDLKLIICDMGGGYDVIFNKGRLVAGVYGVANRNLAVQSTIDLWKQVQSK